MGFGKGKSHGGKHDHGGRHDHGGKHDKWDWKHDSHHDHHHHHKHHHHGGKHDHHCKPPPPPQDAAPSIEVVKTATPATIEAGGQSVTYTYVLTNTSSAGAQDPLQVTSLVDDGGTAGNTADDINLLTSGTFGGDANGNSLLDFGETWTYEYTTNVVLNDGAALTNQVAVVATDNEGLAASDSASATVNAPALAPAVNVEMTAAPQQVLEGSALVTYSYVVTNESPAGAQDPLKLTSLVDDRGTTATGDDVNLLADSDQDGVPDYYVSGDMDENGFVDFGEAWHFSYQTQVALNVSGQSELVNFVTVAASDDEGVTAGDTDDSTVNSRGAIPKVNIEKIAPETIAPGGAQVTYVYKVTNSSPAGAQDPLKIFVLVDDNGTPQDESDDIDLLADGVFDVKSDTDADRWVDHNETWVFQYTTEVVLAPGESLTNTVVVRAADDEGAMDEEDPILNATASASATVTAATDEPLLANVGNSYDVDLFA